MRISLNKVSTVVLLLAACSDGRTSTNDVIEPVLAFRIGEVDGPPEYAFGQIATVVGGENGGFFTCDINDMQIRRYDGTGKYVGNVGRRGAGPGEYQGCTDLALTNDGSLVVNDQSNARFVIYDVEGTYVRQVRAAVYPGFGGTDMFFVDTAGRYWKRGALPRDVSGVAPDVIHPEGEFGRTQFVILDSLGNRVDSTLVPLTGGTGDGRPVNLGAAEGMYVMPPTDTVWTVMRTGSFVVAATDAYHVEIRRPDGTVTTIEREMPPVEWEPDERAEWESWRAYIDGRQPQYRVATIPARKPMIRGVRADGAGRVWVQVHVRAEKRPIPAREPGDERPLLTWRERNTYDLYDARSGDLLGRVALPYATELLAVRGDRFWLLEEGESGEQVIAVFDRQQTVDGRR